MKVVLESKDHATACGQAISAFLSSDSIPMNPYRFRQQLLRRYTSPPGVNITPAQEAVLGTTYNTSGSQLIQTLWDSTIAGTNLSAIYAEEASPLLEALGSALENVLPDGLAVWDAGQEAGANIYQARKSIFSEWGDR